MKLRVLVPNLEQIERISDLYISCFNASDKGENWTADTARSYFLDRRAEGSMFAVLGQHDLQAICCGSAVKNSFIHEDIQGTCDRSFYVSLIAVSPSLQGQGLGKKIMADYCTMIKASGFDDVYVRCRESNGAMRHILDLNSFGVTQRYDSELGGVVCTRLIYKKSLAS